MARRMHTPAHFAVFRHNKHAPIVLRFLVTSQIYIGRKIARRAADESLQTVYKCVMLCAMIVELFHIRTIHLSLNREKSQRGPDWVSIEHKRKNDLITIQSLAGWLALVVLLLLFRMRRQHAIVAAENLLPRPIYRHTMAPTRNSILCTNVQYYAACAVSFRSM